MKTRAHTHYLLLNVYTNFALNWMEHVKRSEAKEGGGPKGGCVVVGIETEVFLLVRAESQRVRSEYFMLKTNWPNARHTESAGFRLFVGFLLLNDTRNQEPTKSSHFVAVIHTLNYCSWPFQFFLLSTIFSSRSGSTAFFPPRN